MSQHGCPERLSNRSKGFQEEGAGQATMEVLVETLTGTAFEMTVSPSDTVFAIKSKIFRVEGIPVSQQHLVYNLKELEDSASLLALGITDGARLRLVLGMRGGPISTRRLPPPPSDLGSELERLLTTNHRYRESGSWAGSSGCKVTVLVFRDGERVNMLRVRENRDGTLQPLDHANSYAVERATATATATTSAADAPGDNAVTMNKMTELRRRMGALAVRRRQPENKPEIQKTRSEETLSVPSLLDDGSYPPYDTTNDAFTPLYDGHYTRYYDSLFSHRYTLLPPIGSRTDSEQSVDRISEEGECAGALAGSILVAGDDGDGAGDGPAPGAGDGGALVTGGGWRARAFGSSSQLTAHGAHGTHGTHGTHGAHGAALAAAAHSASSLSLRSPPPLGALFSSSTSDLETLKRNILPLSRHRNREHLHLSDEGLDHTREIGSERRQRRIKKIAELESSRMFRFGDSYEDVAKETDKEEKKDKKIRIRCGFCKKRLSIATVHKCRCGAEFCAPHRYAEVHGCAYDYKANAHQFLTRANPLVSAPKLPKI